jgi:hypothetical protein
MKNQIKLILVSVIGVIASGILFLFIVQPNLNQIQDLKNKVVTTKTELKQIEEQIVTYKNSQRDLSLASGKDALSQAMLKREDLEQAIVEIENAASVTNTSEALSIHDDQGSGTPQVKPLITGKASLDEVQYTINITSDFVHLINFLQYLEHMPHFTEISDFTLASTSSQSNSGGVFLHGGNVIGSINLVFFLQKK